MPNDVTRSCQDNLISNALDFLYTSVGQLEKQPKFSLVNFVTGLELIFKARLFHAHWSFIFLDIDKASIDNLRKGDFNSITLPKAIDRIKSLLGDSFIQEEQGTYDKIRTHRNKIMHFYSDIFSDEGNHRDIETILIEELVAWYYIHKRLTSTWNHIFKNHEEDIFAIRHKMHENRKFLREKYNRMKDALSEENDPGGKFAECHFCGYPSAYLAKQKSSPHGETIEYWRCDICNRYDFRMITRCNHCGEQDVVLRLLEDGICSNCLQSTSYKEILPKYEDLDPKEDTQLGYCIDCVTDEPIAVLIEDEYFCLSCLNSSPYGSKCRWCNETVVGMDLTDSYLTGCCLCEGKLGNDRG